MIEFKDVTVKDKGWIDNLLSFNDYGSTEYNFSVLYIWKDVYKAKIARYKDFLLAKYGEPGRGRGVSYMYPAGRGDIKEAVELLIDDAKECGVPFVLIPVLAEQKAVLEELFPGRFSYTPNRDGFDYIYSAESLITLKGKKYQSKRNFVSRFKKNNNWSFEPITSENIEECRQMNDEWCALYGCANSASLSEEGCSVRSALRNFQELKMEGALLRVDGKVAAFSIGEKLNSNTVLIHIEKAFAYIEGAYPAISQMFLESLRDKGILFELVNREDDAGDEGLRKAKLQYHPLFMIEKYIVADLEN